jgi:lysozyme
MVDSFSSLDIAAGIVRSAEGLRLSPYRCPAGLWTVGYGRRCNEGFPRINEAEADAFLLADLQRVDWMLGDLPLSVCQRAAVLSLVFNIGVSAFRVSTMRKKIMAKDYEAAGREFLRWVHHRQGSAMVVSNGLAARRERERFIFDRG